MAVITSQVKYFPKKAKQELERRRLVRELNFKKIGAGLRERRTKIYV